MIVLCDISERIDLKASKISEKMKTIMFCSISHELRSPLNHISGILSILKTKLATNEQNGLMKIAESSTEILKMKIDDILDFYEVESGNFNMDKMKFDVRNQCKELESVFLPLMNEKKVKLLFYVHEKTPDFMTHDVCRIHKILVNLISNSVKYTKSGAIVVSIDWKENTAEINNPKYELKYSVADTGIGINKEKKLTLFKFLDPMNYRNTDFADENNNVTTSLAGTGLGISQKIAHKLGSEIEYTSTQNVGSTFWFKVDITDIYYSYYPQGNFEIYNAKTEMRKKREEQKSFTKTEGYKKVARSRRSSLDVDKD
jgi:two-component system sensor histidine kinase BarA